MKVTRLISIFFAGALLSAFLFSVTSLLSMKTNLAPTAKAQEAESMYLDGPNQNPIHMHSNITLSPVHMHHLGGVMFPADPRLSTPTTTDWQQLCPYLGGQDLWHLSSWKDLGYPFSYLSPNDEIDMTLDDTGEVKYYHVDRMTITLELSGPYSSPVHEPAQATLALELKATDYDGACYIITQPNLFVSSIWHEVWPEYNLVFLLNQWIDDPQNPDNVLSITDAVSFDQGVTWYHVEDIATDLILRWIMMDPTGTKWHEVYPDYCDLHFLTSWNSHDDEYYDRISPQDGVDMVDLQTQTEYWYFVDRVTITINVTEDLNPEKWMLLELKTTYFREMYNYIKHPDGSAWHEVYPVYSPIYDLQYWDPMDAERDNCNGILDPGDHVFLIDRVTGDLQSYYIEDMCYDIILNRKIADPTGTYWHEIYPVYGNPYSIVGWTDDGSYTDFLSPDDEIQLEPLQGGPIETYIVKNVTLTLNVSFITPSLPPALFECVVPFEDMYVPKIQPVGTWLRMVYPLFSSGIEIYDWQDNCNGVLSYCDNITLPLGYCHIEKVSVDIVVEKLITPEDDVAVVDIDTPKTGCIPKETHGQGDALSVYVKVENQGDSTETFSVTAYANASVIGVQSATLLAGANTTLTFIWVTTGYAKGNYMLRAEADIVPNEVDTADNIMFYGYILLTFAGDVDGDRDVDIFDVVRMAGVYGIKLPNPLYDPNSDVDNDGDIDIFDLVKAVGNYGKKW